MHNKNVKELNLDIHLAEFDESGLKDYYFPVGRAKTNQFALDIANEYAAILRDYPDQGAALSYKIAGKYILVEAITVFHADRVCQGFKRDGVAPIFPGDWRVWPKIMTGRTLTPPPYAKNLQEGPSQTSILKRLLSPSFIKRALKLVKPKAGGGGLTHLSIGPLKVRTPSEKDYLQNIIALQRTELIQAHAQIESRDVIFQRSNHWFKKISHEQAKQERANAPQDLELKISAMIENLYARYDVHFEAQRKEYLANLLGDITAVIRAHLKNLDRYKVLPSEVWTGSAGNIWDLLLRIKARERGAKVAGHDHGGGVAYLKNTASQFIELWGCDEFYCYSDAQAAYQLEASLSQNLLDKNPPHIKSVSIPLPQSTEAAPITSIKNIVVMGTIYDGERSRMVMGPSDQSVIDWEYRLLKFLKDRGYNLSLKHHPEGKIMPPKVFEEKLQVKIDLRRFEEMADEADLLIFDAIATSTVKSAMLTQKPMVFVNLEDHPFMEEAKELFKRRVAWVEGRYDDQNRVQINWQELEAAIAHAPSLVHNRDFIERYFT